MKEIMRSELVTNNEGGVYHLNLLPEHIADTIIMVGDPNRVSMLSEKFDSIEVKRSNREIVTHTGYIGNKRLTVISTGMGTDNIDIVLTELDVLANFDLKARTPKPEHRTLDLIRVGTCGIIHSDMVVGKPIVTKYSLGLDGLMYFYECDESIFEKELTEEFTKHVEWSHLLPSVYCTEIGEKFDNLIKKTDWAQGITLSAPGFYGPQGRQIRLPLRFPYLNEKIQTFKYKGYRVNNYEMESSAIYGLGKALGHNTLTVCLSIANRATGDFLSDYKKDMNKMIEELFGVL